MSWHKAGDKKNPEIRIEHWGFGNCRAEVFWRLCLELATLQVSDTLFTRDSIEAVPLNRMHTYYSTGTPGLYRRNGN